MKRMHRIFLFITLVFSSFAEGQGYDRSQPVSFSVVPLGVKGGLDESNLSAYMLASAGSNEYICLDAGTLYAGIHKAVDAGLFPGATISDVTRRYIKAYFISHAHLDHVAGLIINSPDDTAKTIYAMPYCLQVLKEKYFTWQSWANFGDEGEKPILKKYHYQEMASGEEKNIDHTDLAVKAFPLSHGEPYQSTAYLVRKGLASILYLGDTGADTIEHAGKLHRLWQEAGPLIKNGQLRAIFIEVSFPDEQPEKLLFGHLTPRLLMGEMKTLSMLAGPNAMRGLPLVITHRKPSGDQEARIRQELEANNPFQLRLVFPEQGVRLQF